MRPFQARRAVSASQASAGTFAVGNVEGDLDLGLGRMRLALLVRHVEIEVKHALVAAAQHGENAVRGHVLQALAEVEIVGELGALGRLALGHLGGEHALRPLPLAQFAHQLGLLGHALDQDVARAVQRRLGVGHALLAVDEPRRLGVRQQRRVGQQRLGQRLQARLAGDLRLGAALGAIGRVQVLQRHLGIGFADGACQLRGELALLLDAPEHGGAPVLQLAQVAEPLLQLAQLGVVQPARPLLAVAGDERHGCTLAQQAHRRRHLSHADAQLRRDALVDLVHAGPHVSLSSRSHYMSRFQVGLKAPRGLGRCSSALCLSVASAVL